ncbi:MAG: CHASE2 domain-containing protein [Spirochaetales bacterium]|nr:CHASE2 domain-containing protein [Spirochaetales bacterium]MCF7939037.1 CHASE2 domain-containing protein [Spirochaetales bacterium]
MKKKIAFDFLIPILIVAAVSVLSLAGLLSTAEHGMYDLFLHMKPQVEEDDRILLLDVDDLAIAKVGTWPWNRSYMANGLILMKEFSTDYVVFDIEYTEKSPLGVNQEVLNEEIPDLLDQEFQNINMNVQDLFQAVASGAIPADQAEGFVADLIGMTNESKEKLRKAIRQIARNNDLLLGRGAAYFEDSYFTVNMLDEEDEDVPEELRQYALSEISLPSVENNASWSKPAGDIRPAILPILSRAGGAGFPNIIIDEDGVRRRVNLLRSYQDNFFGQLAFRPLLDLLGSPSIRLENKSIVLESARIPGEEPQDISLPLTPEHNFLITWPKSTFADSFRHLSYYYLVLHDRQVDSLIHNLQIMESSGMLSYYRGDTGLLEPYRYAERLREQMLEEEEPTEIEEYRQVREFFFTETGKFLNGDAQQEMISDIEGALSAAEPGSDEAVYYEQVRNDVKTTFNSTREIYNNLVKTRTRLEEDIKGAFIIVGHTGTSTTDRGVNPFQKVYDNVGTHAAVINSILTRSFIDELPLWYSLLIGLALTALLFFAIRNMEPVGATITGIIILLVLVGGLIGFFLVTSIYVPVLPALISTGATFLMLLVFKLMITAKEKNYIRNAFSHYLSTDVINDLLTDPDKLNLGGEKKHMTAFFSDVKGFSTVSEHLDPSDLVKLLNAYLTDMSDIILSLHGTIDKYEGDAIIAFYGAPIEFQDHAKRACLSAVRIKKMERILNEHFLQENLSPTPLYTRIGVNTGEMVVGNMGTAKKMDYTIMGNSVNLAARLEGVNKQYGTWLLISEDTYKEAENDISVRMLDRVRVVGINKPVRLYELVDERSETPSEMNEAIEVFHEGLKHFEEKSWDKAENRFQEVKRILPEDGPSNLFLDRCKKFKKKPPAANWDGVFNLTMK